MKIKYNKSLAASLAAIIITASIASAVIRGDDSNNEIYGTAGNDNIYGLNGNDTIFAREGDDFLNGGDGDDVIFGMEGDDFLNGGDGDDVLSGMEGNDYVIGNSGDDQCYGNQGFDIVVGLEGNDFLSTGSGGGGCYGDWGNDTLTSSKSGLPQYKHADLAGGDESDTYLLFADSVVIIREGPKKVGATDGINKATDIMRMYNRISNTIIYVHTDNPAERPVVDFFEKNFKGAVLNAETIEELYFNGTKISWPEIFAIWLTQPW